jgi:hypothetical protein
MKKLILIAILALFVLSGPNLFPDVSEVKNTDNPAKGELYFKLEKEWEIEAAGDSMFANIRAIRADDSGAVYIDDEKNTQYYILDKNGKLITSFGKTGEGPGEIKDFYRADMSLVGEKIIIAERDKLHHFTNRGEYIRSYNITSRQRPVQFLNPYEYITAHLNRLQAPDGKGKMRRVNLKTGEESVICGYSMFEGGAINTANVQAAVVSPALTPLMTIGYHKDRIYYGMNDRYTINVSDMKGKILKRFSLARKQRRISDEVKVGRLVERAKGKAPKDLLVQLAKTMPNDVTHFVEIQVHNGLIYAFSAYYVRKNIQRIDIFSPEGKYLYRAFVKVPEELVIETLPYFKNGFLYLVLQNEDGEETASKYKVNLPEK